VAKKYKLKEVFAAGGVPSVTYVGREHLQLEAKIERALARGYAFNVVTGPTKSGKSVLCHKVLDATRLVTMEGGQVSNSGEFWEQLSHRLQIAAGVTETEKDGVTLTGEAETGWNIGALLKLRIKSDINIANEKTKDYKFALKIACIDALVQSQAVLLVDDFHYLDQSTQKEVIQALKAPVMKGLTVFLLAVPHRAFDPITVENEVEGRFKHIAIPTWDMNDLEQIAILGMPALNIKIEQADVQEMAAQSSGNPLLMQEICAEFCLENKVLETEDSLKHLDSNLLPRAYREVAESKGFPKFDKLRKGPQAKKLREARLLNDDSEKDIYSVIMMALANAGPKQVTSYDELRSEMRSLIHQNGKMPQKNEITSALSHMTAIARKDIEGEPAIEWVKSNNEVVVTDPFLIFYMKHTDFGAKG